MIPMLLEYESQGQIHTIQQIQILEGKWNVLNIWANGNIF